MRLIRFIPLLATAIVLAGLFASPLLDRLDGFSIDSLFLLRQTTFGALRPPAESPTVIVAIDDAADSEETRGLPVILLTPQLGRVIDAVNAAGAKLIGFDFILPASVESLLPGNDRPFLLSLKRAADEGRLVLAKQQGGPRPMRPTEPQSAAVGHSRNIRAVDLEADPDGIVRRVPLFFDARAESGPEQIETSFALELAARAGEFTPVLDQAGLTFGPSRVPGSAAGSILLNFNGGPGTLPTYSLADLAACATLGNMTYFRRAFAGKIVVFGGVLDIEDRVLTSKRFITGSETARGLEPCVPKEAAAPSPVSPIVRHTLPSAYVQATAINNLLLRDPLSVPARPIIGLILFGLCLVAGFVSQVRHHGRSAMWLGVGAVVWLVVCVGVFRGGIALPLVDVPIVGLIGFAVPAVIRLAITDRERNRIRRAFSDALAPETMKRLLAGGRMPTLSGEARTVTILNLGVEGLAQHAEGLPPETTIGNMRAYLDAMTRTIQAHGGFVDNYDGETVRAVFGAPLEDTDHALHAVRAARDCERRLATLGAELDLPPGHALRARIGISTGPALVGDVGAKGRFNYTVAGDTVTLAEQTRLANAWYGTGILAAYDTVASCGDRIAFREIDRVAFPGRGQPSSLFEPLAEEAPLPEALAGFATAYSLALADYRAGRFAQAAERFAALAADDGASQVMAERCRRFVASPPPEPWLGVSS
ncbi:MAG: CHASE2 domain-containing protein [Alphaproteobacteria bacterium]